MKKTKFHKTKITKKFKTFKIKDAIDTKITKRFESEQKTTTGLGEKIDNLVNSEKQRENRLKSMELKLKNLEKDITGEIKFGKKEQKELVTACTGVIKNAERIVYLLRASNQFPLANNNGVNNMLADSKIWSIKDTEDAKGIFMTLVEP